MSQAKNGHTDGQLHKQAKERQQEATTQQTAASAAAGTTAVDVLEDEDFAAFISGPGIERDGEGLPDEKAPDLEQNFSAEFSRHLVFGDISRDKWETEGLLDHARSIAAKAEYVPQSGPGSKCSAEDRRIMTGSEGNGTLTADMARQIDSAFEERTMARSLSIGARAFRGLTEIISENRSENSGGSSGSSLLNKLTLGAFGK